MTAAALCNFGCGMQNSCQFISRLIRPEVPPTSLMVCCLCGTVRTSERVVYVFVDIADVTGLPRRLLLPRLIVSRPLVCAELQRTGEQKSRPYRTRCMRQSPMRSSLATLVRRDVSAKLRRASEMRSDLT